MGKIHHIAVAILLITIILSPLSAKKRKAVAYDSNDSTVIANRSVVIPKGKMCIVVEPVYDDFLPGWDIFKNKSKPYSNSSLNPERHFWGGVALSNADTVFTSNILVRSAVYQLVDALPPGVEYIIVESDCCQNAQEEYDESLLKEQLKPDVIVFLRDLIFFVKGDLIVGSVLEKSINGGDSYSVGAASYYSGYVSIAYQALWKISWEDGRTRVLEQRGLRKSKYRKNYDFVKDLFSFSKEAGGDFAKLLTRE